MRSQLVTGTAASGDAAYNMHANDQHGVGRVTSRGAKGRFPHRLRRLKEVWLGHGYPRYFLTICVLDRQPVLANVRVHDRLKQFLLGSLARYGWWMTRYVVLPDHLHLLAAANTSSVSPGVWVKALKAFVGQREFQWQPSFFDHVIRHDESEAEKWEYIRQNPVRAGLVTRAEDWLFAGELNCEHDNAASGDAAYK